MRSGDIFGWGEAAALGLPDAATVVLVEDHNDADDSDYDEGDLWLMACGGETACIITPFEYISSVPC